MVERKDTVDDRKFVKKISYEIKKEFIDDDIGRNIIRLTKELNYIKYKGILMDNRHFEIMSNNYFLNTLMCYDHIYYDIKTCKTYISVQSNIIARSRVELELSAHYTVFPYIDHVITNILKSEYTDIGMEFSDNGNKIVITINYNKPSKGYVFHNIPISAEYEQIKYLEKYAGNIFCAKLLNGDINIVSRICTESYEDIGYLVNIVRNNGTKYIRCGIEKLYDNKLDYDKIEAIPIFDYDPINEIGKLNGFKLDHKISEEEE